MQANWSLVLNVLFLVVIVSMIVWRLRPMMKKEQKSSQNIAAPIAESTKTYQNNLDDILNVRKISVQEDFTYEAMEPLSKVEEQNPQLGVSISFEEREHKKHNIMLFVSAKGQHIFAGYELLQTLLTCGLRFGDGGLFHRHQHSTGQGPVLFSLAAATATGMFDLQNIGAMSVKGLCMFMELSHNPTIDQERFELFIKTAQNLATELNANLLDDRQKPINEATITKLERLIAHEQTVN